MKIIRNLLVAFTAFGVVSACQAANPLVLIVQEKVVSRDKKIDLNVAVDQYLAEELQSEARCLPVVWGLSDTLFRSAVDDGIIKNPPEVPDIKTALSVASKLKADYVIFIVALQEGSLIKSKAILYERGKVVWVDPPKDMDESAQKARELAERNAKKKKVQMSDQGKQDNEFRIVSVTLDSETSITNGAHSVARTWAQLLTSGPLRKYQARPTTTTPDPEPGPRPTVADVPPVHKVDNQSLIESIQKMIAKGEYPAAINALRDAVDSEPLDIERRRMLISVLSTSGMNQSAALEARRASALLAEQTELRVMAARAWMRAGIPEEAQADLNEAVARDPANAIVRQLMGEMNLMRLQVKEAIENFDASLVALPNAETYFNRGVALSIAGDSEKASKDFETADKSGLEKSAFALEQRFGSVAAIVDGCVAQSGANLRTLFQSVRLDRKSQDVSVELQRLAGFAAGLTKVYGKLVAPERHKGSSEVRTLALNLLVQCLSEVDDYVRTGDIETMSDATLNLGEALKQLASAREKHKSELDQE